MSRAFVDSGHQPPRKAVIPAPGEDSAAPPELLALLTPFPPEAMRGYPVSTVVNSPKNDTPECVEAVEQASA